MTGSNLRNKYLKQLSFFVWPAFWCTTAKNARIDLSFHLSYGCAHAIISSIAFIVLKQHLAGSDELIAVIQSGTMVGLLLSLPYSKLLKNVHPKKAFSFSQSLAWLFVFASTWKADANFFAFCLALACALFAIATPFQVVSYSSVYKESLRGQVVSNLKQWQTMASALASWMSGWLLAIEHSFYVQIFIAIGILGLISSLNYRRLDFQAREYVKKPRLLHSFHCLLEDSNFRNFLILQFILGLSNIGGVTALQIYVNDPNRLGASASLAATLTGILPAISMFLSLRFWGRIFDKISITRYRAITSCLIGLGFFCYPIFGIWGAAVGAIIWSLGRGGGQLAWSIGILAFAPKGREAEYLSVHTFLTGLRGIIAPFLAVAALSSGLTSWSLFWITGSMILISALATVLLIKDPKDLAQKL